MLSSSRSLTLHVFSRAELSQSILKSPSCVVPRRAALFLGQWRPVLYLPDPLLRRHRGLVLFSEQSFQLPGPSAIVSTFLEKPALPLIIVIIMLKNSVRQCDFTSEIKNPAPIDLICYLAFQNRKVAYGMKVSYNFKPWIHSDSSGTYTD